MISSDRCVAVTRRTVLGLIAGAAALSLAPIVGAWAQGLDEARSQGYLGERPDGYLGQVAANAPAWAIELMERINIERRAKYTQLAASNNTSLEAVQVVAGEKIIASLPPGTYYMDATGRWVQK